MKKKPAKKAAKKTTKKTAAKKPLPKKTSAKKTSAKKIVVKKAAKKPAKAATPKGVPEQMLDAALKVLDERQAQEIVTVPLQGRSSLADYMIIASGRASRQITALADYLREAFYKLGVPSVHVEGQSDANWILVDAGDVVVHLFLPEVRKYYDLDSLWTKKPSKR